MTALNKQALRVLAENATPGEWCADGYHGVIADAGLNANYYIASCSGPDNRANKRFIAAANPATVLALLDENYRLTVERDALRENIGGDNTRAAADIYFQLVEECEIPPGGSLVGYVDDIKERLSNAENHSAELDNALCELLPGTQYMDPPDGGSVTPLEQVRRMIADYRGRIEELESREVTLPKALNSYAGVKIYRPNDVIEAIRAAVIGVKGE
ncbi:ead/Ea22-like family protein [Citrobacter freundii]|uniref:ead/Ea22-like family protein n=1 Tax=Citrobacter freundii TaxID=546 RepID=UPI001F329271|nr:ead/Ea22-like family protein [Citrobacter freundii]